MTYVFIFTSNDFRSWKIEERKRERARRSPTLEQEDRIGARRLHRSDHSNPPSSNPVTDHRDRLAISGPHTKRETERERRSTIAPDRWWHQSDDRTSPTIAPDRRSHQSNSNTARSRLRRTISHSPPPIEPSRLSLFLLLSIWPDLMNFFAGFCFFCEWVWNWFIFHMFTAEEVYGKLGGLAM